MFLSLGLEKKYAIEVNIVNTAWNIYKLSGIHIDVMQNYKKMEKLDSLISEGKTLLNEVISKEDHNVIRGELVSKIKSLHTKGRFYLKKIDKSIYNEYSDLFSETYKVQHWEGWNNYLRTELEKCLGVLMAINSLDSNEVIDKTLNKVFISHGKFPSYFNKIELFIKALGLIPIYDINEPSQGKNINTHIKSLMDNSDFYIILATKETIRGENTLPNHNVIIEFDRLLQADKRNLIVLLEDGCKMPSMVQDVIYITFKPKSLDQTFISIATELNKAGLIN